VPIRSASRDDATPPRTPAPLFTVEEVGLSNRQVWAATLAELARRGDVSRADVETWLRPAGLIGRDGATLIVGAPNAVARDRIVSRLLPHLRQAIAATIGVTVGVEVIVETGVEESSSRAVEEAKRPSA
jgi:chromosomal replication initiation ATPase DnaA